MNRERVYELLNKSNIDALIATSPENVYYFSGFESPIVIRLNTFVVIPREKSKEQAIVAHAFQSGRVAESDLKIKDVRLYGEYYVEDPGTRVKTAFGANLRRVLRTRYDGDPGVVVSRILKERGLGDSRIAWDEEAMPVETQSNLQKALPGASFVPGSQLTKSMRMVKTSEEAEELKKAAQINEQAYLKSIEVVRPGATVAEISDFVNEVIRKNGAEPRGANGIGSGEGNWTPTSSSKSHVLEKGDVVRYDIWCKYRHAFGDFGRTVFVEPVPGRLKDVYGASRAGIEAELALIRPGVKVADLFRRAVRKVRSSGIPNYRRHHTGHGIGLEPYEMPIVAPKSEIVLEEGTVLNCETPYYELGLTGIMIEDTIRVTRSGHETFTSSSKDLISV